VKLNFTGPSLLPQDSVFTTNFDTWGDFRIIDGEKIRQSQKTPSGLSVKPW
jgi:hypothetical protein